MMANRQKMNADLKIDNYTTKNGHSFKSATTVFLFKCLCLLVFYLHHSRNELDRTRKAIPLPINQKSQSRVAVRRLPSFYKENLGQTNILLHLKKN